MVPAADFFTLPSDDAVARERPRATDEVLAAIALPAPRAGARSTYHKVLDREAWTHAVVSAAIVLQMNDRICRSARIVLGGVAPVPWRLPEVEKLLAGQRITPALADEGRRRRGGRRPAAGEEWLQGAADARNGGRPDARGCGCGLRNAD